MHKGTPDQGNRDFADPPADELAAQALEQHPQATFVLSRTLQLIYANKQARALLFRPGEAPLNVTRPSITPYVKRGLDQLIRAIAHDGMDVQSAPFPLTFATESGSGSVTLKVRARVYGPGGSLRLLSVDPRPTMEYLHSPEREAAALHEVRDGVLIANDRDQVEFANAAARQFLDLQDQDLQQRGISLVSLVLGPTTPARMDEYEQELQETGEFKLLRTLRLRAGAGAPQRRLSCHVKQLEVSNDSRPNRSFGSEERWRLCIVEDLSAQEAMQQQLRNNADTDVLTGVLNRGGFLKQLEERFAEAQRVGDDLGLLYIDLDNFKYLNDHHGHAYGDALLRAFSERIRKVVKQQDIIGRIGGDEFIVLSALSPGSHSALESQAQRLLKTLIQPYRLLDLEYSCSASIGAARYPRDATNVEQLLHCADMAMYQAKEAGKNRFCEFDSDWSSKLMGDERLLRDILDGVENSEFIPYFQPQHELETGSIIGAEALVRWVDPTSRQIRAMPNDFLPLIANHPVLVSLGRLMIDKVYAFAKTFFRSGQRFEIAVNLSPMQLQALPLVERLTALAEKDPPITDWLVIEITEGALFEQDAVVLEHLRHLRKLGYRLALDDFGTGYASINSLLLTDFSRVKIDKSFLGNVQEDSNPTVLLGILQLLQKIGHELICEGVETVYQRQFLLQHDCRFGQGFLYAPALEPASFQRYLLDHVVAPLPYGSSNAAGR